jgi:signal transduction histidine kinase
MIERELQQTAGEGGEDAEVITSVIQEIRQPLSSIVGYTDLLLSESVGILGALQRKFLERIKASTERMHATLKDLIQISTMSQRPLELLQQPIALDTIVDHAVTETSAQLREKNIALRVDLPEELPEIVADRDAFQQIVVQLLQNAGAATPQEGAITLRAKINQNNDGDYLLIQVTDTGGGVHPDDLPRVFARRYRADMPLIQGLGDTGVGLSIAKSLVEAHHGRIWVDSMYGQGTTFSILLPVSPTSNGERQV